jgi:hypothetical protein
LYCQYCGQRQDHTLPFCAGCGKPLGKLSVADRDRSTQELESSIRLLGILWLVYSMFRLFMGAWMLAIAHFMLPRLFDMLPAQADRIPIARVFHVVFAYTFIYSLAEAVLVAVAAAGLWTRASWGRAIALVVAFISLIGFPFGTALGIYTLTVLLPSAAERGYRQLSLAG